MEERTNKTAIITGAGKGIGKAIAGKLGAAGFNIVIGYLKDRESAEATRRELKTEGIQAIAVRADITSRSELTELLDIAVRTFGGADVLVNNAAVNERAKLSALDSESIDMVIDTNLKGTLLSCQIFGQYFVEKGSGCIVNISSTAALRPLARSQHYVAAKAGIIGLTRSLAISLAPFVTVNAVAPGFVQSERHLNDSEVEEAISQIPLQRCATVDDIAGSVAFLVTDGRYITGQTIVIDGGYTLSNSLV